MTNTTFRSTGREAAEDLSNVASDVTETVADAASRIQDRASEIGKKAVDQFTATTEYFREHDVKEMMADVNEWVKRHPAQALVAAAAVGFVAATILRRR